MKKIDKAWAQYKKVQRACLRADAKIEELLDLAEEGREQAEAWDVRGCCTVADFVARESAALSDATAEVAVALVRVVAAMNHWEQVRALLMWLEAIKEEYGNIPMTSVVDENDWSETFTVNGREFSTSL